MTDIANLQLVKGATLRASWFVKNEEGERGHRDIDNLFLP